MEREKERKKGRENGRDIELVREIKQAYVFTHAHTSTHIYT